MNAKGQFSAVVPRLLRFVFLLLLVPIVARAPIVELLPLTDRIYFSFLRSEFALQDTLALFADAGISTQAADNFTAAVQPYNSYPDILPLKFPPPVNGFYRFDEIKELTDSVFSGKMWTTHPPGVDCFATVKMLTEGWQQHRLYCTVCVLKQHGHCVHEALLFKRGIVFTLVEKSGLRGPFLRMDFENINDLAEWFKLYFSPAELSSGKCTLAFVPLHPGGTDDHNPEQSGQ